MAAAEIIRENILENLKTSLQAIDTEDDYNFTLRNDAVSRNLKPYDQISSSNLPALFVSDGSEVMVYDNMGSRVPNHFNVIIRGMVEDRSAPSTELNKLIADTKKAILTDLMRGVDSNSNPSAGNTKILRVDTDQGMASPRAIFEMEIEVVYYTLDVTR